MVVALNPGAPMAGEAARHRQWGFTQNQKATESQAGHILEHCTNCYTAPTPGRDTVFHRKTVTFARSILWLFGRRDALESVDWMDDCWFTDLFKCSTRSEVGPAIPIGALAACRPHLTTELMTFTPLLVLTFGRIASAGVRELVESQRITAPVFPLPFPVNAGLAPVTSATHDAMFNCIATVAGRALTPARRAEFAAHRKVLRSHYFP